jgi:hypothetical protein
MYSDANNHVIYERSKSIPIKQDTSTSIKNNTHEYSLKQNFFDPSKCSPPNEFMIKLRIRSSIYGSRQECR